MLTLTQDQWSCLISNVQYSLARAGDPVRLATVGCALHRRNELPDTTITGSNINGRKARLATRKVVKPKLRQLVVMLTRNQLLCLERNADTLEKPLGSPTTLRRVDTLRLCGAHALDASDA